MRHDCKNGTFIRFGSDGDAAHGGVAAGQQRHCECGEQAGQPGALRVAKKRPMAGQACAWLVITTPAPSTLRPAPVRSRE